MNELNIPFFYVVVYYFQSIDESKPMAETTTVIPKIVFIVPYRDRLPHKTFFTNYTINVIMRDYTLNHDYALYFAHQKDARPFNRGAMKNIGFLAIKYKYPADYKNITFVFNDIDTVPYDKSVLDYETPRGKIKHFYGFTYALGGIFSINGDDFERIGGFPNFWAWGCEDNCIYNRAIASGIVVDRSTFFPIGDQRILQLYDGATRSICRSEALSAQLRTTTDSLLTIRNLTFDFNSSDMCIDVTRFDTAVDPQSLKLETQNIFLNPQIDLKPAIKQMHMERNLRNVPTPSSMAKPQVHQVHQVHQVNPNSILRRPFMMGSYNKR
jgi:hypothetical protein